MAEKPSYDDLKQKISELEKQVGRYQILFEKSENANLIIKNEQFVDCNQAAVDMMGYKNKAELIQTHPSELSPEYQSDGQESFTKSKEMMAYALKNGSHRFEWDHMRASGEIFPVEVLLTTISHQKDTWVIHAIWRDISNRKQIEKAAQKEKQTLSTILESTPHGITLIDNQGKYLYVNPHFTKITGYTLKDFATKEDWFKKAYPDKNYRKQISKTWMNDSNHSGDGAKREFKVTCKDGRLKDIEFRSTFLEDKKISVLTDVSQSRRDQKALKASEERLKTILSATPDPIVIYSCEGQPEYVNPAFISLFGWSLNELKGKRIPFVPDDQKQITAEKLKEIFDSKGKVQFETKRLTKSGSSITVIVSASCIKDVESEISNLVVILTDITEQKQAKKELKLLNLKLEHEATHDPLTGAPNRRAILYKLTRELDRARRKKSKLSIGLCDIDHFKNVNDEYGHQVGDDVLCCFVQTIQSILRPYDLVGRYGGEEFLLVVPESVGSVEEGIYERVRAKIADHKMTTRSGEVDITISIGVTNISGFETSDEMLAAADAALYKAKNNGRNQLAFAD